MECLVEDLVEGLFKVKKVKLIDERVVYNCMCFLVFGFFVKKNKY